MEKVFFAILTAIVCFAAPCRGQEVVRVEAGDSAIKWNGRIDWDTRPGTALFSYPGVRAQLNFTGESLALQARQGSGYFVVEIDDEPPFKVSMAADSVVVLAEGLEPGAAHKASVTYAIEGHDKHPAVRGFEIGGEGAGIGPRPADAEMMIEFVGDSMMCAYGVEKEEEKGFSYASQNFCKGFAYLTARALGADYALVGRSGQGIYRNYNGPITGGGKGPAMPYYYDRTLYDRAEPRWDFKGYTPDVVVVDLGTNDTSCGIWDVERMTGAYVEFLGRLRGYYPEAWIVMATGSMRQGEANEAMKQAMDRTVERAGDPRVRRVDLSPQTGSLGRGGDGHPSERQHAKMARELARAVRGLR